MSGEPIGHRDGVIRAVKISSGARLVDRGLEFTPVNPFVYERTPASADARCLAAVPRHAGEPVPALHCTCGFWGCGSLAAALGALGRQLRRYDVVLAVELSGRVVEHDHGWRAAHQEVSAVVFQQRCERCSSRRRVRLCAGVGGALRPRCAGCVEETDRVVEGSELGVPVAWLPRGPRLRRSCGVRGSWAVPLR